MLFNSLDFALFLPAVFALYWSVPKSQHRLRTLVLLIASYVFYGNWDARFLLLIAGSTVVDYAVALQIEKRKKLENYAKKAKPWLWVSILANLGTLALFKYFNFFLENVQQAFTFFGSEIINTEAAHIKLILPVGISFYTFQTLSYTIDVYRKKLAATNNILEFGAYVSFFPQLVAGPIERATQFLPQFTSPKVFNYEKAVLGMRQILWGLFQKVVIADSCARVVNQMFANYQELSGLNIIAGIMLFAFQIYGDFAGYSNIAIGTAKLFGFDLMKNFNFPYFSRNIGEFWRRWHISLSTWFRDYLYIPLGGSRGTQWVTLRNVAIVFIVSGFWHGANWTFIVWGVLHALFFIPELLLGRNRTFRDKELAILPSLKECMKILFTFLLVSFAWTFFRANSVSEATNILQAISTNWNLPWSETVGKQLALLLLFFLGTEWFAKHIDFKLEHYKILRKKPIRWAAYLGITTVIFFFIGGEEEFIYFQF